MNEFPSRCQAGAVGAGGAGGEAFAENPTDMIEAKGVRTSGKAQAAGDCDKALTVGLWKSMFKVLYTHAMTLCAPTNNFEL